MIQEKIKAQLDQIKSQSEKLQSQANKQVDAVKAEGLRILAELGAKVEGEELNLSEVVADLREANPSIKQFVRNLDVATYDNRFRLSWNANMGKAYAKLQANKTFATEVEPRINEARETISTNFSEIRGNLETQFRNAQEKAKELRNKFQGNTEAEVASEA